MIRRAGASQPNTRTTKEVTTTRPIAHRPSVHARHRVWTWAARPTRGKRRNDAAVALVRTSDAGRSPKRRHTLFRILGGHVSDQPIAALQDGLNEARFLGVVAKDSAQFRNGSRQHVVGDERVWPHRPNQVFLGDNVTCVRGEAHQHLHHLGLQANGAGRSGHAVQRGLDAMRLADAEGVLHGRCSQRNYSTAPEAAAAVRQSTHRLERSPLRSTSDPVCCLRRNAWMNRSRSSRLG